MTPSGFSLVAASMLVALCASPLRAQAATPATAASARDSIHVARPIILVVHGRGLLGRDSSDVRREAWLAIRNGMLDLHDAPAPVLKEGDVRLVWYADVLDSHFDDGATTCSAAISRADSAADGSDVNPVTLIAGLFGSLMDAASSEATGSDAFELRSFAGDLRYLSHPATRCAAESRLHAALRQAAREGRPVILVSHSLGALVSWSELSHTTADSDRAPVARWLTIGSPLGSPELRELIFGDTHAAIATPARVGRWTNIVSPDDPVSMRLQADSTSGIAELTTERAHAEPHQLVSYLSDPATARVISDAWRATVSATPPH